MPRKKKTETEEGASAVNPAPTLPAAPTEKDSRAAFYALDFNGLDRNLPPEVQQEWMAIYASFRSRSALSGAVVGVDRLKPQNGQIAAETPAEGVLCLVIINHRVKVLIPQTEIWHDSTEEPPDFVINGMVGANAEYVITHVDKEGDFALGSRKMALGFKRNRFMNNRNGHRAGEIVDCNILSVGPVLLRAECGGFDFQLRPRDVSYTAMMDLRNEYKPGQLCKAKITEYDPKDGIISISIKEVNPNPYIGAKHRHPPGNPRKAVVSGTYGGGVFCRIADGTTVLCSYSPERIKEGIFIGDTVKLVTNRFDDERMLVFGYIVAKW